MRTNTKSASINERWVDEKTYRVQDTIDNFHYDTMMPELIVQVISMCLY